jgi:hypothetical protein
MYHIKTLTFTNMKTMKGKPKDNRRKGFLTNLPSASTTGRRRNFVSSNNLMKNIQQRSVFSVTVKKNIDDTHKIQRFEEFLYNLNENKMNIKHVFKMNRHKGKG